GEDQVNGVLGRHGTVPFSSRRAKVQTLGMKSFEDVLASPRALPGFDGRREVGERSVDVELPTLGDCTADCRGTAVGRSQRGERWLREVLAGLDGDVEQKAAPQIVVPRSRGFSRQRIADPGAERGQVEAEW